MYSILPQEISDAFAKNRPRYKAVPYSQSAHCCFEATVLDTTKPHFLGGEHYCGIGDRAFFHYDSIAECFDIDDAELIAALMNKHQDLLDGPFSND
jgi:hypothetical protein